MPSQLTSQNSASPSREPLTSPARGALTATKGQAPGLRAEAPTPSPRRHARYNPAYHATPYSSPLHRPPPEAAEAVRHNRDGWVEAGLRQTPGGQGGETQTDTREDTETCDTGDVNRAAQTLWAKNGVAPTYYVNGSGARNGDRHAVCLDGTDELNGMEPQYHNSALPADACSTVHPYNHPASLEAGLLLNQSSRSAEAPKPAKPSHLHLATTSSRYQRLFPSGRRRKLQLRLLFQNVAVAAAAASRKSSMSSSQSWTISSDDQYRHCNGAAALRASLSDSMLSSITSSAAPTEEVVTGVTMTSARVTAACAGRPLQAHVVDLSGGGAGSDGGSGKEDKFGGGPGAVPHNVLSLGVVALVVGCVSISLSLTSPGMVLWRHVGLAAVAAGLVLTITGGAALCAVRRAAARNAATTTPGDAKGAASDGGDIAHV